MPVNPLFAAALYRECDAALIPFDTTAQADDGVPGVGQERAGEALGAVCPADRNRRARGCVNLASKPRRPARAASLALVGEPPVSAAPAEPRPGR